jgi:diguanylate cyclase (GGDEF)-like protein
VLAGVAMILLAMLLSSVVFSVVRAERAMRHAATVRAQSAIDLLATLHVQSMLNRTTMGDDDGATRAFDATMAAFSRDEGHVRVWMAMSAETMYWQARRGARTLEPPRDAMDRAALASRHAMTDSSGDAVRIVRPVVLGQGAAADSRCLGCHGAGPGALRPGQVIGVYSAQASMAEDRAQWRTMFLQEVAWLIVVALAALLALALWLRRALLHPLRRVERIALRMAHGQIDRPVAGLASSHEFGRIGAALEQFRQALVQKRALAEYNAFLATHDGLTGLPNRGAFAQQLRQLLVDAGAGRIHPAGGAGQQPGASPDPAVLCVMIDLVRFKAVNDRHGREAGDALLCAVARALRQTLQAGEHVARLHGDEFAACRLVTGPHDIDDFLARLARAMATPLHDGDMVLGTGGSIGYALAPEDGACVDELMGNADLAMRRTKADPHLAHARYDRHCDEPSRTRVALLDDLAQAVARGQIVVHYQAQHDTMTGAVVGYEALARWIHPTRGLISPAVFIPLAEETGLIDTIGAFVLREACHLAAREAAPVRVAVNVSAVQLCDPQFDRLVHQVLVETGLSPSRLELELTETALITHRDRALHAMRRLKALGVQIAVDDFGVGYSSLEAINLFPIDKIKIDRSFVTTYDVEPKGRLLLKAIVTIGESLQVPILAEGVETPAQLAFLRSVGCTQVQGFLLDHPRLRQDLPLDEAGPDAGIAEVA